ncbi:sensor domain-containing protein [Mycobacterium sp. Marseille-P9652]|uniref:sensor domain-containing protein n=1 Tax=Mycobacterium sp. Marseille-P9652 TaxID=2654950 RepID=UPI0012E90E1E|nr:sensor domain-containing protein [Mycobacterium sp. Marseille-P9652]
MTLFVSHSSQDKAAIQNLLTSLRDAHQQVWVDEKLGGGDKWWRTILEQIRGCEVFVFALSTNSLASKPCQAELRYAEALHRPILPVQVGPVDSMRVTPLAARQIVDYRNPTVDKGIQLVEAVHELKEKAGPLPSPLPDEPPVPFAYLMRLGTTLADPELSAHQQAELVSELKAGLYEDGADPAARRDIARLLHQLRDRPDVTYHTRTSIDALLESIEEEPPTPAAEPVTPAPPEPAAASEDAGVAPPQDVNAGKRRRPRTKWFVAGGTALAIVIAIVVAAVLLNRQKHGAAALSLESVLVSDAEINSITRTSNMTTTPDNQGKTLKDVSKAVDVSPRFCVGVLYPAADLTYEDSGESGVSWRALEDSGGWVRAGEGNHHFVDQAVVAFPSTDRASDVLRRSANEWKACDGQIVTATYRDNARSYTWLVDNLTGSAPRITQTYSQQGGGPGYSCQRVLQSISTYVIDVKACGDHITDEASRIVDKIVANMPKPSGPKF